MDSWKRGHIDDSVSEVRLWTGSLSGGRREARRGGRYPEALHTSQVVREEI